jgi:hypothetical protein
MNVPFLDLQQQYRQIEGELMPRLRKVMADATFVLGEEVREFEGDFAKYCGTTHVVGVANGTDAIMLALKALGIQADDEVITAVNTFVATVEAIEHVGAKPAVVDCDPATYTLAPRGLERAFSSRTRAVVAVHLYGRCADMDPISVGRTSASFMSLRTPPRLMARFIRAAAPEVWATWPVSVSIRARIWGLTVMAALSRLTTLRLPNEC